MHRALLVLGLAGCDLVFELEGPPPFDAPPVTPCTVSDLAMCFTFDGLDETATSVVDESGNANDVTLENTTLSTRRGGHAITLDPTSKIEQLRINTLDLPSPMTFEALFNYAGTGQDIQAIIDNPNQWGFVIDRGLVNSVICTVIIEGDPFLSQVFAPLPKPNEWHHAACIYDAASGMRLYVDGQLKGTDERKGPPRTNVDARLRLGNFSTNMAPFEGSIDNVRIFTRALTDAEIIEAANQ